MRNTACGHGALPDTVPMRWSKMPRERAWMLEHAAESPIQRVIDGFEREFGVRLNGTQVSLFRAMNGMGSRKGCQPRADRVVPVGTERVGKDGYILVKVREAPTVPMSKDNWELKNRHVWEVANGRKVPDGCIVMFADGDKRNFDPENLVAVPRMLIGRLNHGPAWHDRESLMACIALCDLEGAVYAAETYTPRKCAVCGAEFTPDASSGSTNLRTCRRCLDAGRKAYSAKSYGTRRCRCCGAEFEAERANSSRCRACRDAKRWRPLKGAARRWSNER